MGLDFIYVADHIEKETGCRIDNDDMVKLATYGKQTDITLAELLHYLNHEARFSCRSCQTLMSRLDDAGACPKCGASFQRSPVTWDQLREIVSFECGILEVDVTPHLQLIKDLGF